MNENRDKLIAEVTESNPGDLNEMLRLEAIISQGSTELTNLSKINDLSDAVTFFSSNKNNLCAARALVSLVREAEKLLEAVRATRE